MTFEEAFESELHARGYVVKLRGTIGKTGDGHDLVQGWHWISPPGAAAFDYETLEQALAAARARCAE